MVNVRTFVQLVTVAAALCVASTAAAEDARMLQSSDASTAEESLAPVTRSPSTTTTTAAPATEAPTDAPSPTPVALIDVSLLATPAPTPEPTTVAPTPEPVTVAPTPEPVTLAPTPEPTAAPEPTTATPEPSTAAPAPVPEPTTLAPAPVPEPTTLAPVPVPEPTTPAPVPVPEPTTPAPVPVPEPTTPAPVPVPEPTTPAPGPTTVPVPEPTTPAPGPTTVPVPEPTTPAPGPTTVPVPEPTTPAPGPTTVPVPEPTTPAPGPTNTPSPTTPKPTTTDPPLVDVIVATEKPDTPAPSVTKKGDLETKTPEPEDNAQANLKDIIVANTNDTSSDATTAPKVNPFEIREINTDAPKPVVLDIKDESTSTAEPKLYVRGAKTDPPGVIDSISSGSATGNGASGGSSTSASSPSSASNIIGGSHRNTATSAEAILSSSSQAFHDFLRYATCAFAGISVALLLFFHYVSLDATLTWTSSLWSPNTWEFILYVSYLQQMGTVSQLTLLKTPYFLWDYTDSFAWTNFLIERSVNSDSRRLETIVLGGVVAYGDRIGISEETIVYHSVVGFAVVIGILLLAFLVIAMLAKRKAEQVLDDPANMHSSTQGVHQLRSASIRTLGLCVLIWYFALYPLSTYASFEISMEVQAKETVPLALLVSILAIGVVCFGVLAWCGRVIMHKSKDELLQFENMATWGSLYAEFSFRSRMFFILGALVQIVTGIIVGTMDSDPTQLIIVILIEVLYLIAVFVLSPFAEVLVLRFTYALGLLKIVNFGLSFGFLNSNGMSDTARNGVANAYIGINTLVIIFWFIRQLIVFSTYIRAWAVRSSFVEEHNLEDSTAKYETRTATDSEVYASVTTARHGDGGPGSSDDDYHHAPPARDLGYL